MLLLTLTCMASMVHKQVYMFEDGASMACTVKVDDRVEEVIAQRTFNGPGFPVPILPLDVHLFEGSARFVL